MGTFRRSSSPSTGGTDPEVAEARLSPEQILRQVARDGVVLRRDARAAGLSHAVIDKRLANGFLDVERRGVYRLAGSTREGATAHRAALAAVSGRALGLYSANLVNGIAGRHVPPKVHVMVDWPKHYDETDWYVAHPTRRLDDDELVTRDGVLATSVVRTLRDFAAFLPRKPWADEQIIGWTEEAIMGRKLWLPNLKIAAERERSKTVKKRLLDLYEYEIGAGDPAEFKSECESWLRTLVERHGLPMPQFNVKVKGVGEVDAFLPYVPLILEFESYRYHHTRAKHDKDKRRVRASWRGGIPTIGITSTDYETDLPGLERDLIGFITDPPMVPRGGEHG